jgi:NAD(P)-dependent dehydrogenase (short-subunit alcohol dehydrogenase family)
MKNVLVTGGSSGIGLSITKKFIKEKYNVAVIGRDEKKMKILKEKLGDNLYYFKYDLAEIKSIPYLVNNIADSFGVPEILVNNAGINMKKEFFSVTDEEFLKIINVNTISVFALSREVGKKMAINNGGVIINISSMASQYGLPKVIAYTASKSAIEGMTRAMAVELAQYNIRVNCVAPGFIMTEMSANALNNDPERKQKVLSRTPMGRLGTAEEIANTVFFLANNESSYITGTVLPVDGGNSIGF